MLVELLGGDAGVVVIDGRAVVADELAALRERMRERFGEEEPEGGDPYRAARWAVTEARVEAARAFAADWQHQRGELRPAYPPRDGEPVRAWEEGPASWTHRATGERLGPWEWYQRAEAADVAVWVAEAARQEEAHGLAPETLGRPRLMTKPDPWPGDAPALEGG